jgi:deoxycytidylate deaminase
MLEDGHCVRTNHAEANAIIQAARMGVRLEGAGIYVTASPCWPCQRLIINAGITFIAFEEDYRQGMLSKLNLTDFDALKIRVGQVSPKGEFLELKLAVVSRES